MNRLRTGLILLALLVGRGASAQTSPSQSSADSTTFRMIRATVEFLASDKKTYGQKPRVPCQPCAEFGDLDRFVKQNKLLGADQLIAEARKKAALSSPAELRTFLLDRVTGGARSFRTKLPSFANYQQTLNAAVGGTATPASPVGGPMTNETDVTDTSTVINDAGITNGDVAPQTSTLLKPTPYMDIAALALSLISLIGVVLLWLRSRAPIESVKPNSTGESADFEKQVNELKKQNNNLSRRIETLEGRRNPPSNTPAPSGQRPQNQLQPRPVQPSVPAPPAPVADAASPLPTLPPDNPPAPAANTPRSVPTVQYGRTADLGDGFSVGGLVAAPDRDTVFEIHRQSDTAALFQVSDQPDLQRLALSDPYSYLNDTCSYVTQPRPGSRIRTEKPGQLSLQGDKWAIVEKAQISFVA